MTYIARWSINNDLGRMWKAAVDEKFIVLFLYGWRNWGNNCNRNL